MLEKEHLPYEALKHVKSKRSNIASAILSVNTSWEKMEQIDFLFSLYLLLDMSSFDFCCCCRSSLIILYFFLFIFHFEIGGG